MQNKTWAATVATQTNSNTLSINIPANTTNPHLEYLPLLEVVERLRVFHKNQDRFSHFFQKRKGASSKDTKTMLASHNEPVAQAIEHIHTQTIKLLTGKFTLEVYLQFLLENRFMYLVSRGEKIQQRCPCKANSITPTDKDFGS